MSDLFAMREEPAEAGCLSALELDRLLAEEPAADALRDRLEACEHCGQQLAALRSERDAYLADYPPRTRAALIAAAAAERAPATSWWSRLVRWQILAPLSAVAAAVVAFVVIGGGDDGRDRVRVKGGSLFEVLSGSQADGFDRLDLDRPVTPGTTLGFRVGCSDRCALTIAGIGARGPAYELHAEERVEPGAARPLDITVDLDDEPGAERLYAAFCARPLPAATLLDAVDRAHSGADPGRSLDHPAELSLPSLADCEIRTALLRRPQPTP